MSREPYADTTDERHEFLKFDAAHICPKELFQNTEIQICLFNDIFPTTTGILVYVFFHTEYIPRTNREKMLHLSRQFVWLMIRMTGDGCLLATCSSTAPQPKSISLSLVCFSLEPDISTSSPIAQQYVYCTRLLPGPVKSVLGKACLLLTDFDQVLNLSERPHENIVPLMERLYNLLIRQENTKDDG